MSADELNKNCRAQIEKKELVSVTYTFSKLPVEYVDNVEKYCQYNDAAGCFAGQLFHTLSFRERAVRMGKYSCVVPTANVNIKYNGKIYMTKEYSGCKKRAVLRHELQHFFISKIAVNEMIKELHSLANGKAKKLVCAAGSSNCSGTGQFEALHNFIAKVFNKWEVIMNKNNKTLDTVDHNHKTEVNYTVCKHYPSY
ncbi:MAG: hypothetical protein J6Y91_00205 [Alphaproteobacteria bacterium]|nr:hypothetical protein [Alphaproteobacteria bacterium]